LSAGSWPQSGPGLQGGRGLWRRSRVRSIRIVRNPGRDSETCRARGIAADRDHCSAAPPIAVLNNKYAGRVSVVPTSGTMIPATQHYYRGQLLGIEDISFAIGSLPGYPQIGRHLEYFRMSDASRVPRTTRTMSRPINRTTHYLRLTGVLEGPISWKFGRVASKWRVCQVKLL